MLKKLSIGLLAVVAIVLSVAARQGSTFDVARQIDIRAAPARIAPLMPALRLRSRAGASPNNITAVIAATSTSTYTVAPQGAVTRVTWRIQGPLTLRTRLITSFIGMDILLGSELEQGLATLKAAAEK